MARAQRTQFGFSAITTASPKALRKAADKKRLEEQKQAIKFTRTWLAAQAGTDEDRLSDPFDDRAPS